MRKEFEVHRLNEKGLQKAELIAKIFNACLEEVESVVGAPSREMSLVCTKLEEACFLAKKAMANNLTNQYFRAEENDD